MSSTCQDDHLGRLLGQCEHRMRMVMDRSLRQYGVTPAQCRALMYLHRLELRAIGPYPELVSIDFAALAASGVTTAGGVFRWCQTNQAGQGDGDLDVDVDVLGEGEVAGA